MIKLLGPRPTYAQGFARSKAEAEYPELWKGLVGLWAPCLGRTGLTLFDWSGNGNHGTLTNMAPASDWVMTEKGWALDFDGTNDYIDTNTDDPLDLTSHLTIAGWVYRTSSADTKHLASKYDGSTAAPWQFVVLSSTNKLRSYTRGASGPETLDSTDAITLNAWHHIAMARNTSQLTFYIDGKQDSGGWQNYTAAKVAASTVTAKLGARGDGGASEWIGRLRDISIYNRALTPSEIATLYVDPYALSRPRQRPYAVVSAPPSFVPYPYPMHELSGGLAT